MSGGAEGSDFEIRPVAADEFAEFVRAVDAAAGLHATAGKVKREALGYTLERTVAAFDGPRIVGGSGSDVLELTLPGPSSIRVARIKATGVLPTHRRRGVLTRMMLGLFSSLLGHDEPVVVFSASEGGIYGRFGAGPAAFALDVEIEPVRARLDA